MFFGFFIIIFNHGNEKLYYPFFDVNSIVDLLTDKYISTEL